jgi:hypothetical protein
MRHGKNRTRLHMMKKKLIGVAAVLVNKSLKVSICVVTVVVRKVPYGIVAACMN